MSKNLKVGLMGAGAIVLGVIGYMVYNNSNSSTTSTNKATINATASNAADKASDLTSKAASTLPGAANANTPAAPTGPKTVMSFDGMDHDFGNIDQNTENEHVFKFTNTGTEPLIISNAKGSCGCTVPEYPKEPIAPGEDGEIRVVYKPGKQKNKQTKRVTVTANTEPEQTVLKITAEVRELEPAG